MLKNKYIMTVSNGVAEWEEEVNSILVDKGSHLFETHEEGWHEIEDMTPEQFEYHAKAIVDFFNKTLRRGEKKRTLVATEVKANGTD